MTNVNQPNQGAANMSVYDDEMIIGLFNNFIKDGGLPKVTAFKKHLNELINVKVKPLCGSAPKSADGSDWRSQLKTRFSGKGAKWVLVSLQEISPTITQFESEGINCDDFKTFTEAQGAAWIRFSGPRIDPNGHQAAAFEVRTGGCKIDHPKQLHFISLDVLDETIRPMEGTPHSLKFEVVNPSPDVSDELNELDEGCEELELSGYELNPYDDGGSAHVEEMTEFDHDAALDAMITEC